jgi:hypothetical protein
MAEVSPSVLRFAPSPKASSKLKVANHSARALLFKVKTTNLQRFRVRPTHGIVQPGSAEHVTVRVGALPADGDRSDRFKVLLLPLPDDARQRYEPGERRDSERASELWAASDETSAEVFKVRASFNAEPTLLGRISEEGGGSSRSPPPIQEPDAAARAHSSQPSPGQGAARTARGSLPRGGLPIHEPKDLGLRHRRGFKLRD